jgi:hypothetical protein
MKFLNKCIECAKRGEVNVGERGAVNIGTILMMSIGMIFLAVGFIMFPNVTNACTDLLAYAYSGNATITDATYTGFTTVVGIFPLLTLLGYIAVAVISGFMGVRIAQGEGSTRLSVGGFLMLGISLVFISLGLYIFPVLLDGISSVVHGSGQGISSSFTGLSSIILMTPMLVMLGFMVSTVITGFFGIKSMSSGED